jgi:RNA polymerase sigma-70 factor (ECF subfamily)
LCALNRFLFKPPVTFSNFVYLTTEPHWKQMREEVGLIKKVQDGSSGAFKKLYDKNAAQLFRFLCQFTKDRDQVQEWVQRAFIKAYQNINAFQGKSKFSTWLFSIGINEMKSDMRLKRNWLTENMEEINPGKQNSETEPFDWKHDMKWLLSELDPVKKSVLTLFEVEGYSHAEIAEMMDISEMASRTILSRTKQLLRNKWNAQEIQHDKSR